jgi:hypothetical protein
LGVSLGAVLEMIDAGKRFDRSVEHRTVNAAGDLPTAVTLRFVVVGHPKYFDSWNVTLLIHNRRIDGFGWEQGRRDIYGIPLNGWHRHCWDAHSQHAEGKLPAASWPSEVATLKEFVTRAFNEMNIFCEDENETSNLL